MNSTFENININEANLILIEGSAGQILFKNDQFLNITVFSSQGLSLVLISKTNDDIHINFCIFDSVQACTQFYEFNFY